MLLGADRTVLVQCLPPMIHRSGCIEQKGCIERPAKALSALRASVCKTIPGSLRQMLVNQ
jgi:hypothetical protein